MTEKPEKGNSTVLTRKEVLDYLRSLRRKDFDFTPEEKVFIARRDRWEKESLNSYFVFGPQDE